MDLSVSIQCATLYATTTNQPEKERKREKKMAHLNVIVKTYQLTTAAVSISPKISDCSTIVPAPLMPRNIPTIAPLSRPIMSQSALFQTETAIDRSIHPLPPINTIALITRNQRQIIKFTFFFYFDLSYFAFKWHRVKIKFCEISSTIGLQLK